MIYSLIALGVLYVLGAYLMWIIGDDSDEDDVKKRPYYAVFWPCVVIALALENLIMKEDE